MRVGTVAVTLACLLVAVVVTHNLVTRMTENGIVIDSTTGATIAFNGVSFSGLRGIAVSASSGVTVMRNHVSRSGKVDCSWDGLGTNVLGGNNCGTQEPAGAFD